ncbi:hypothetical protein B9Z19DRAFT_1127824 [Tuber borchii]|uniref:Cupredoxin n=1 Tax=Tuber borchii TaxID=42251 RepID=A0A2T6ZQS2_TUBBO|nr:hypothetical protein B9Z19DRAFT_1127824 [Tuber borchii]
MRTSKHSRSGTGLLILAALQTFGFGVVRATAPSEYPPPEPVTMTSISVASVATETLLSHIIQTETRTQQIAGVPMLTSSPPPPAAVIHTSPLPVIIVTRTTTVPCDTTTPIGGAAAGTAAAATHTVTVGGTAGLVYTPPQVSAAVGDLVHFIFMSNNHSVTQSTFAAPCNRLATGMDSDLRPNLNNSVVPPPFWAYTVMTTEPTWWYCKQRVGNHCGQGMVFAINPTADKTFQMFKDTAIKINGTVSSATTPAATGTKTATALTTVLPSATAGGSSAATTHTVTVGGTAGLVYTPPQVSAAVGDLVHFIFMSNNHSVTQSTFAAPCNRLATGMDSDLRPNLNNSVVPPPFWAYTVMTTEPTWWYCKQRVGNHCGQGMVFAINPTADKTFQMFKDTAIKINGTVSSSATTTPAATGATKTATALTTVLPSATAGGGGSGAGAGNEACKCQCFCPTAAYKASTQINAQLQSTTMQTISTPPAVAVVTNATILPSMIYSPSLSSLSSIPTALSLDTTTTKPISTSSTSKSTPAPTLKGTPTALAAETPKTTTTTTPPPSNPNSVGYSSSLVLGLGGVKSTSFSQMNVDFNTYSSLGGLKSVLNLSVAPAPTPRA